MEKDWTLADPLRPSIACPHYPAQIARTRVAVERPALLASHFGANPIRVMVSGRERYCIKM